MLTKKTVLLSGALIALTATMFLLPACNILFLNQQQPTLLLPTRVAPPPGDDGPVTDPSDPWGGDGDDGGGTPGDPDDVDPGGDDTTDNPDADPAPTPQQISWNSIFLFNKYSDGMPELPERDDESISKEIDFLQLIFSGYAAAVIPDSDVEGFDNNEYVDGGTATWIGDLLDAFDSDEKPTFFHIAAHGVLSASYTPSIWLNGHSISAYEFSSIGQYSLSTVKTVFLNFCYGTTYTNNEIYDFRKLFINEKQVNAVIGTQRAPWGLSATFMAVFYYAALLAAKNHPDPTQQLYEDDYNINSNFAAYLEYAKAAAESFLIAEAYETANTINEENANLLFHYQIGGVMLGAALGVITVLLLLAGRIEAIITAIGIAIDGLIEFGLWMHGQYLQTIVAGQFAQHLYKIQNDVDGYELVTAHTL